MSTNKARRHARCDCIESKLYTQVIADAKEAMNYVQTHADEFGAIAGDDKLKIIFDDFMKDRKPAEPTLLQGHTMEQWDFIREQEFDCEFSSSPDFANAKINKLTSVLPHALYPFVSEADNPEWAETFPYCRPRRAKGIKQPWFGGECPVDKFANVVVYRRDGRQDKGCASGFSWVCHSAAFDIIAFIEL